MIILQIRNMLSVGLETRTSDTPRIPEGTTTRLAARDCGYREAFGFATDVLGGTAPNGRNMAGGERAVQSRKA